MEGGSVGHNFERDPPKDHPCQVWFNLVQGFQRRRFKCESLRRTTDTKWRQKLTLPLASWAKNEQNDKHGIIIDWDIEGSFIVWFYYVFRLYSSQICIFANHTGAFEMIRPYENPALNKCALVDSALVDTALVNAASVKNDVYIWIYIR
jgi:hypothetical protein